VPVWGENQGTLGIGARGQNSPTESSGFLNEGQMKRVFETAECEAVLRFDLSVANSQTALIIIQPVWNSHFRRLIYLFSLLPFFSSTCGPKLSLMWTRPP